MLKQCGRCGDIKIKILQFHSEDRGLYTADYDICKKCANELRREAVDNYYKKSNQPIMSISETVKKNI